MTTPTPSPTPTPAAAGKPAAAAKPAAPAAAPKPEPAPKAEPAFALHRINGTIEPGTMFRPDTLKMRKELVDLEAVRDLTEAEELVFAKIEEAQSEADEAAEDAAEDALG